MRSPKRPERDREIFAVLRSVRHLSEQDIASRTYVSASTVKALRSGKTRYPQHHTLAAVARVGGMRFALVHDDGRRTDASEERVAV